MSEEREIGFTMDGMAMPFSAEAEQSVLGAILLDADCLVEVMELLPSGDYFHLAIHKEIYRMMLELFTLNQPIDVVTVMEKPSSRTKKASQMATPRAIWCSWHSLFQRSTVYSSTPRSCGTITVCED